MRKKKVGGNRPKINRVVYTQGRALGEVRPFTYAPNAKNEPARNALEIARSDSRGSMPVTLWRNHPAVGNAGKNATSDGLAGSYRYPPVAIFL
jgi:hypothetical protein